jgi:hypothetical protein
LQCYTILVAAKLVLQKKETPKSAEIKFQNERIDIGVIDGKSNANIDFKFSNTGNIPLSIIEARGNCHCVQAKAPEKAIEPVTHQS